MNPYLNQYNPGGKVIIDGKEVDTSSQEYKDLYEAGVLMGVDYEGLPNMYAPEVEVTAKMTDEERERRLRKQSYDSNLTERENEKKYQAKKQIESWKQADINQPGGLQRGAEVMTFPIKGARAAVNLLSETANTPLALLGEVISGRNNFPAAFPSISRSMENAGLTGFGGDPNAAQQMTPGNAFFPNNPYAAMLVDLPADILLSKGSNTVFKQGAKQIPKALSYVDDVVKTSKIDGKLSLPKYTDIFRWQPDEIPDHLKQAGAQLTPEQQALTGSWYNIDPQMGFYMRTRPGKGTLLHAKLPQYKIKELQKAMPSEAKGMSGKAVNVAKSDDYHPNELIVPKELRQKGSKPIRFEKNPQEYIKDTDEYTQLKEKILENTGQTEEELVQLFPFLENTYKDDAVNMFLKSLIQDKIKKKRFFNTVPSEYIPFKNGGIVNKNTK